jgi:hypothetical protein
LLKSKENVRKQEAAPSFPFSGVQKILSVERLLFFTLADHAQPETA